MGIAVRVEGSAATVQQYKDLGVKHFCVGGDMPALCVTAPVPPLQRD